eukprot:TRINITY_DN38434_c0_g1_i1.p1 TRINITY_DN38434_c0_g1~~TRINITY_DN38434_c0_g1_i1.p1  ORF type:complete len:125 (-),score=27.85 TRINITY_DN38434_c0_g1_i1:126-500(-)
MVAAMSPVQAMAPPNACQSGFSAEALKTAFGMEDRRRGGNGFVSRTELKDVLRNLHDFAHFGDDEFAALLNAADRRGNGVIYFNEFVEWLYKDDKMSNLVDDIVDEALLFATCTSGASRHCQGR